MISSSMKREVLENFPSLVGQERVILFRALKEINNVLTKKKIETIGKVMCRRRVNDIRTPLLFLDKTLKGVFAMLLETPVESVKFNGPAPRGYMRSQRQWRRPLSHGR